MNGFVLSDNNALDMNYEDKEQYSSSAVPMQGTSTGNAKELVGYFGNILVKRMDSSK